MNKLGILLGINLIFLTNLVKAEFRCEQSLTYKWKKAQEESEQEVYWGKIDSKGADEAAAKHALDEPIEKEKKKAWDSCIKEHENLAGCVAAKYSSLAPTMERLGFSQRKSLEEAIQSDCGAKQGKCSEVIVAEAKCTETVSSAAAAEGSGEKKDSKAKKK